MRPMISLFVLPLLATAGCASDRPDDSRPPEANAALGRADSAPPFSVTSRVVLSPTDTLIIPLRGAVLHGSLRDPSGAAWAVVSGYDCSECDGPEQIYLIPRVGLTGTRFTGYPYPGDHLAPGPDADTVYRSRAYFGNCLADRAPVIVWLQQERDSAGWHRSTRVVVPGPFPNDSVYSDTDSVQHRVMAAAKDPNRCRQIEGRSQYIL